jgi:histidinol dehydrogenase
MTAVPARVAGVREIVLVTPPGRDGSVPRPCWPPRASPASPRAGGSVRRAGDRRAGVRHADHPTRGQDRRAPATSTSALAKSKVFGDVGIDMVAGPSEVVVVADRHADPALIAADLLAQAEHDPMARSLLITDAADLLPRVQAALDAQLDAAVAPGDRRRVAGGQRGVSSWWPTSRPRWTWPTVWRPSTWS